MTIASGEGRNGPPVEAAPERAQRALRGIYEISQILAAPGRLDTVLREALQELVSLLDLRHAMIVLLDAQGATEAIVALGRADDARRQFAGLPEALLARVAGAKTPVAIADVASQPAYGAWPWGEAPSESRIDFIGVAIKDRRLVSGLLLADVLRNAATAPSFEQDATLLGMAAAMIGQTLHLYNVVNRDRARMLGDQRRLAKELPRHAPHGEQALSGIIGASRAMRAVFSQINIVARTHTNLLLQGESGAGKELFAQATHDLSPRRDRPFVKLDCSALPQSRLEAELFGQEASEKGQTRRGRIERADGGTLFLDEIGELSAGLQAKLLRVLQDGEFERVDGARTLKADVRFVFASQNNLEAAVTRGEFRADLYYRINLVSIRLPPLRERPEDVALLAEEFVRRFNVDNDAKKQLGASALRLLQACNFPGNVRELENCINRAATHSGQDMIGEADFACSVDCCLSATLFRGFDADAAPAEPTALPRRATGVRRRAASGDAAAKDSEEEERERLIGAMEKAGWVQAKAARLLHLTPRQIAYALGKHQISIKRF